MPTPRDYSTRLVSLTFQFIELEEMQRRIAADINSDFLFYTPTGDDWQYYDPKTTPLNLISDTEYTSADSHWFTILQIDLLRPVADYLDLRAPGGPLHQLLSGECFLIDALQSQSIDCNWSTLCCTTETDHPMSAYRRSIAVLNRLPDGTALQPNPDLHVIKHDLLLTLEDHLETAFRAAIAKEHYA